MMILLQTRILASAAGQEHVAMDYMTERSIFQPHPALPVSDTLQN